MILKQRDLPLNILKLQALVRRLPPDHTALPLIKEILAKCMKGFKGENSIDYPLSFLPDNSFQIIHDIRLQVKDHFFQIDTLILSSNFILIIEVKNYGGTIYFDRKFNQLIQKYNGEEKSYKCPLIQISFQQRLLSKWLSLNKFTEIPIFPLVLISNPSTLIKVSPTDRETHQKVMHRDYLPTKMKQFYAINNRQLLTKKELRKLGKQIVKHHNPIDPPILERFNISYDELIKGVQCPNCLHIPMLKINSNWECPLCLKTSNKAYFQGLKDFYYLVGPTISNKEARDFLLVSSPRTMNRLLTSLNLPTEGQNKGRRYKLIFEESEVSY